MADQARLERIYTIPLAKAYEYLRTRRAERAIKILREFIARHMKVEIENVRISEGVNSLVWRDSIEKPPRRIKVRAVKDEDRAKAWLIGEEEAVKKLEEEKKKAAEAKKKEEEKKKEASKPKTAAPAAQPTSAKPGAATAGAAPATATSDAAKTAGASATQSPSAGAAPHQAHSAKPEVKSHNPTASEAISQKKVDIKREGVKPKTV